MDQAFSEEDLRARNFGMQAGAMQLVALHAESTADGCHPV